ncbi:MAG TPA: hypothetical protein EYG85_02520 [Crocinitomix sp.]|nr:hypothetical protein [Crocinitomix sp.]
MRRILFFVITIVVFSCDKNQKAVKRLDGNWKAIEVIETNGALAEDLVSQGMLFTFNFSNCKLKNDEFCEYSLTTTDNTVGVNATTIEKGFYKVVNDGNTMITTDALTNGSEITIDIVELKKNSAILLKRINGGSTKYTLIKL